MKFVAPKCLFVVCLCVVLIEHLFKEVKADKEIYIVRALPIERNWLELERGQERELCEQAEV